MHMFIDRRTFQAPNSVGWIRNAARSTGSRESAIERQLRQQPGMIKGKIHLGIRRTRHAQFIFILPREILGKCLHKQRVARAHVILIYKFVKCRCAPTAKLQPKRGSRFPGDLLLLGWVHTQPRERERAHLSVLSFGGKQFIVYALSAHLSQRKQHLCLL